MSKKTRLLSLLMRSGEFERSDHAEKEIISGHVSVDGKIVKDPKNSFKINSVIKVKEHKLELQNLTYIILNKPKGVICQKSSKEKTIYDIINGIVEIDKKMKNTLFSIGRLDKDTTGLLIVTNDGQIEKNLTRKEYGILKTYHVKMKSAMKDDDIERLLGGVRITDDDVGKKFLVKAMEIKKIGKKEIEIVIGEGRKRQIKKMLKSLGNEVVDLKRVGIGKLRIEDLDFKNKSYLILSESSLEKHIGPAR
ncbi:MAG: pseudouridine synthase [Candidatus Aenigmatarchaeota archaeon]